MSDYDHEFSDFMQQMMEVTSRLKKMNEAQAEMRWQFDDPEYYQEFVKEMQEATGGWMSSHC